MAKPRSKLFHLYGCDWPTDDVVQIERECIRLGGTWQTPDGVTHGMGLAHHVEQFARYVWPWFAWHRWAKMLLGELCRPNHRLGVFGPSSCVHGDTVIEDPIRKIGLPIREWCNRGIQPYVMTLAGPILASVPFKKGTEQLYEVTLENGRKFRATAEHRVMLPNGAYEVVEHLCVGQQVLGVCADPLPSSSGSAPSIRGVNALNSMRTTPSSQCDYPPYPCYDDERPRWVQDNGQDDVPLQGDAQVGKVCVYAEKDDQERKPNGSHPYRRLIHPSSFRAFPLDSISRTLDQFHSDAKTHVFEFGQSQFGALSLLKKRLAVQAESQVPGSFRTHYPDNGNPLALAYKEGRVQPVLVSSIRRSQYADFYDLNVPGEHHYFAEGAIHHNSGKSSPVGLTYLTFYIARPNETTVLVSSTTRDELELRIWGEIVMFWREAKEQFDWIPGYLTDSKQMISTDGKDSEFGRDRRSGLMGRPCKIGNKWLIGAGTSPFVGIKNDYVYFAGDEAGLMMPGFIDAFANLASNPHFSAAILGNLGDLDTPLGTICEPKQGWDSLADSDLARVYDTRWSNGRAVQFIGTDSPNLDYPEGAEPYPKLIGRRYLKQLEADYGKDTPLYNMFAAGKIPRGTMENRVITKDVCLRNQAFDEITWGHEPITKLYAMDISYLADHGDRTVGRPLGFGKDNEGMLRLALLEPPLVYTPNDRASGSIEEQLAGQCMAECKRLRIPASHVFFDGTGRSSFTAALMRLWSTEVVPIEFGGSATARPNFVGRRYHEDLDYRRKEGDLLPCNEVFGKMVTELWFAFRAVVDAKQLRGLDMDTVKEAEKRLWKITAGNRIDVETKKDMKLRLGRSPDLADCLVVGLEGARRLGFNLGQLQSETRRRSQWFRQLQQSYDEALSATSLVDA